MAWASFKDHYMGPILGDQTTEIDVFCVCVCVFFLIFYVFYHGMHHHFSKFGEFPIKGGMTIPNISSLGLLGEMIKFDEESFQMG